MSSAAGERTAAGQLRLEVEEKRKRMQKLRAASTATTSSQQTSTSRASSDIDALLASIPAILSTPGTTPTPSTAPISSSTSPAPAVSSAPPSATPAPSNKGVLVTLEISAQESVDVPAVEVLRYARQTQTSDSAFQVAGLSVGDTSGVGGTTTPSRTRSSSNLFRRTRSGSWTTENGQDRDLAAPVLKLAECAEASSVVVMQKEELEEERRETLTEEEAREVMDSQGFASFLARTSRIVERAASLNETYPDISADYTMTRSMLYAGGGSADGKGPTRLTRVGTLRDSEGLTATFLAWSPHHQELLLSAHSCGGFQTDELERGSVLVWAIPSATSNSEFSFTCNSPVFSAVFSPAHPQCVIGGTQSGQVVLWDMRSGHLPVISKPPSTHAHTYPIYCVAESTLGTTAAAAGGAAGPSRGTSTDQKTLVSISSDGRMCLWSLRNLAQPLEVHDIQMNARATEITAVALHPHSANLFVTGNEDGTVAAFSAHTKMLGTTEVAEDRHGGPVLSLDCHPVVPSSKLGAAEMSQLFLSSSADWTVKLWSWRSKTKPSVVRVFEDLGDYVFDAKWSPTSPGCFATADGMGNLSLYDLSSSVDAPVEKCQAASGCPLTCVRWHPSGKTLVAADSTGALHIFSYSQDLRMGDEYGAILANLKEMGVSSAPSE